ncbi:hypothetical protein Daus18300_000547 [Diaporthe australafricana]|uniref:Major facilitator superfamily (MFS) profile domain-containing protein n=1 Tax=Diaporthe australafricana TaxID=127596 RepID=A0ABR3Y3R6_9PEZI
MAEESHEKPAHQGDVEAGNEASPAVETSAYYPSAEAPLSKIRFWLVLLSLETGIFAVALDFSIVPTAVPWISSNGNLGYNNSAWIGNAFFLSFALGLLLWPKLCRGLSYKFAFFVALGVFNYASGRAAVSKSAEHQVAWRLAAGAGAGGIYGLFDVIMRVIVPLEEVEKYMSVSRMIWAATAVAGPLIAGALTEHVDPRMCLSFGEFIGLVSYSMTLFFLNLPDPSWSWWSTICRFDYLGTLCLVAGTACMVLATASGSTILPWVSGQLVTTSIAFSGLVLLTAFFIVETLVPEPLLHPSLFRNPGLLTTALAAFFHGANMAGTMYYIPHFFQLVFQNYPLISGVGMLPMTLGIGIGGTASTFITARYRTSLRSARVGAVLLVLASGLMVRWNTDTSRAETVAVLALLGLGQGAAMIGLLHTAQASVDSPALATATMNFMFVQASGFTFGVACFGALYFNKLRSLLAGLGLGATNVDAILADALYIDDNELDVDVKHPAVLALSSCIRQRDAQKDEDSSTLEDRITSYEAES